MKVRMILTVALLVTGLMVANAAASSCYCQCFGLTPGYWKNHLSAWPVPTDTTFEDIGINAPGTLLDALRYTGSGDMTRILLRQAAAAYLNAMSSNTDFGKFAPGLVYPIDADNVVASTNYALGGDRAFMEYVKDLFETYNQVSES